jgi:uncharacterized protein (TIGR02996 family)
MFDPYPFINAITENLPDAGPKLVYADALDENGFPTRAAFVRWLGRTGRYPIHSSGLFWMVGSADYDSEYRPHTVPSPFDRWTTSVSGEFGWYLHKQNSWPEFERHWAEAWAAATRPTGLRRLFRSPWVPDYTPIIPWASDENSVRIREWSEGVR